MISHSKSLISSKLRNLMVKHLWNPENNIYRIRLNTAHNASQHQYYDNFAFPLGASLFNLNGFCFKKNDIFHSQITCKCLFK